MSSRQKTASPLSAAGEQGPGAVFADHKEEVIGKVLTIQDLSPLKEMEAELERSRRMAAPGKMAAGIAHEIRNPLATLRGFAQFSGNLTEGRSDSKEYSQLMISEIDRLNQTVASLLRFSRPRELQRKEVALDSLFEKTVKMMTADIAESLIDESVAILSTPALSMHSACAVLMVLGFGVESAVACQQRRLRDRHWVTGSGNLKEREVKGELSRIDGASLKQDKLRYHLQSLSCGTGRGR